MEEKKYGSKLSDGLTIKSKTRLDDASLDHLVVQVVTLAGALSHSGKHGETTVVGGDVVDELHDDDGLPDTGTAEQSDLTTLGVGGEQVNHLGEAVTT